MKFTSKWCGVDCYEENCHAGKEGVDFHLEVKIIEMILSLVMRRSRLMKIVMLKSQRFVSSYKLTVPAEDHDFTAPEPRTFSLTASPPWYPCAPIE